MQTTRPSDTPALVQPVGIFDAGIGSYDLVRRIRAMYPQQDVLYLADRASFPYGAKSEDALLDSVERAALALESLGATSIILASNAPSVTVLEPLRARLQTPLLGVVPPVRSALATLSRDRNLVIAGANVLTRSPALARLVTEAAGDEAHRVHAVAADDLIDLVESGAFLNTEKVEQPIISFITALREQHPRLGGLCLSSTHLPWLAPVIAHVSPDLLLFDPADSVVDAFAPLATHGSGELACIATASEQHPLDELESMLRKLDLDITPTLIEL